MTADTPASKRGRPSLFNDDVVAEICQRLAYGESLNGICQAEHMPHESTVRMWAVEDYQGFATKYARAREIGYLKMADDILDISDDSRNDWMERRGLQVVDKEAVERSKLRVDSRKWLLAKALPKIYGDKLTTEHKIGFTEEFEAFMRELKGLREQKVIDGSVSDTSVTDTSVSDVVAREGSEVEVLPVPLRP